MHTLQTVCNDLGVPLAAKKQAGPATTIEFLGIIIDTIQQELRLPEEKLNRFQSLLKEWIPQKSCTRHELESLTGILQHACTVLKIHWTPKKSDPDISMIWAPAVLCFFGFFRVGEITTPSLSEFDSSKHLAWGDVAIDDPQNPQPLSHIIGVCNVFVS